MTQVERPSGNGKLKNIVQKRENQFPIFSLQEKKLTPLQASVVYEVLRKSPKEKWIQIAKRLHISERHLYNLRTDPDVIDTASRISFDFLYSDLPDVLKALSSRAKAGDIGAIRVFLEQVNGLERLDKKIFDNMERSRHAIRELMTRFSPETKEAIYSEFLAITQAWQKGTDIKAMNPQVDR